MDLDLLPPQLRVVIRGLDSAVKSREPAIRAKVNGLRSKHPDHNNQQLARELIRSTRRRVAATGALSGAGVDRARDWNSARPRHDHEPDSLRARAGDRAGARDRDDLR